MKNFQQLFKNKSQIYDKEFLPQKDRPIKTLYIIFLICFCVLMFTTVKYINEMKNFPNSPALSHDKSFKGALLYIH